MTGLCENSVQNLCCRGVCQVIVPQRELNAYDATQLDWADYILGHCAFGRFLRRLYCSGLLCLLIIEGRVRQYRTTYQLILLLQSTFLREQDQASPKREP